MFNSLRNKLIFAMISYTIFIAVFSAAIFYRGLYVSENTYLNTTVNTYFDYISLQALPEDFPYLIDLNTRLYLIDSPTLPAYVTQSDPGLYEIQQEEIHYRIGLHPDGKMIVIVLQDMLKLLDQQEERLEAIITSIVITTILVGSLIVSYLVTLLMRRLSDLSSDVDTAISDNLIVPNAIPAVPSDAHKDEIDSLRQAFSQYSQQLLDHAEREKYFTQHASHELRTPVAIIKNCYHILMKSELNEQQTNNVVRIGKAADKAKNLTDCFLLLARHHSKTLENVNVEDVLLDVVQSQNTLLSANDLKLSINSDPITVSCHPAMFDILCSNLIGNAVKYGQKYIDITLTETLLTISNQAIEEPKNQGFGLIICQRICDYLDWNIQHHYEHHVFTTSIEFK